jgi:pSer/pThr/pTyr-binding forkhead associated (FHA) protein
MPIICPKCGSQAPDGHLFCNNCGGRLTPLGGPTFMEEHEDESVLGVPEKELPPFLRDMGGPGRRSQAAAPLGRLVVRTGEAMGTEFVLDRSESMIGRSPDSDVYINDKLVSRRHAKVTRSDADYVIEDLNSSNGTFVNGQRVMGSKPLRPRDTIQIGTTSLLFQMEAAGEAAPPPKADFGTMLVSSEAEEVPLTNETQAVMAEEPESQPAAPVEEPALAEEPVEQPSETAVIEPQPPFAPMEIKKEVEMPPAYAGPAPVEAAETPTSLVERPAVAEPVEAASEPATEAEPEAEVVSADEVRAVLTDTADVAVRLRDALEEAVGRSGQLSELAEALRQSVTAEWEKSSALLEQMEKTQSSLDEREDWLSRVQAGAEKQEQEIEALRSELDDAVAQRSRFQKGLAGLSDLMQALNERVSASSQQINVPELTTLVSDVVANPRDIDYASALTRRAASMSELLKAWDDVSRNLNEASEAVKRLVAEWD